MSLHRSQVEGVTRKLEARGADRRRHVEDARRGCGRCVSCTNKGYLQRQRNNRRGLRDALEGALNGERLKIVTPCYWTRTAATALFQIATVR